MLVLSTVLSPDWARAMTLGTPSNASLHAPSSLFNSQAIVPHLVVSKQLGFDRVASRINTLAARARLRRTFLYSALALVASACGLGSRTTDVAPKIAPMAGTDRYVKYQEILGLAAQSDSLWHLPSDSSTNLFFDLPRQIMNNNHTVVGKFLESEAAYADLLASAAQDRTLVLETDRHLGLRGGIGNGSPRRYLNDMLAYPREDLTHPQTNLQTVGASRSFLGRLAGALVGLRVGSNVAVERTLLQGAQAEATARSKRHEIDMVFQALYRESLTRIADIATLGIELDRLQFQANYLRATDSVLVRAAARIGDIESADRMHIQTLAQVADLQKATLLVKRKRTEAVSQLRSALAWTPGAVPGDIDVQIHTLVAEDIRSVGRTPMMPNPPFWKALQLRARKGTRFLSPSTGKTGVDVIDPKGIEKTLETLFPQTGLRLPATLSGGNTLNTLTLSASDLTNSLSPNAALAASPYERSLEASLEALNASVALLELNTKPTYDAGIHMALGIVPIVSEILGFKVEIPLERSQTRIQIQRLKLLIARVEQRKTEDRIEWRNSFLTAVAQQDAALQAFLSLREAMATDLRLTLEQLNGNGINVNYYPAYGRVVDSRFAMQQAAVDLWAAREKARTYLPGRQAELQTVVTDQLTAVLSRAYQAGETVRKDVLKAKPDSVPAVKVPPKSEIQDSSSKLRTTAMRLIPAIVGLLLTPSKLLAFSFKNGPHGTTQAVVDRGDFLGRLAVKLLRAEGHQGRLGSLLTNRIHEIAQANGIQNIHRIREGQVLDLGPLDPSTVHHLSGTPVADRLSALPSVVSAPPVFSVPAAPTISMPAPLPPQAANVPSASIWDHVLNWSAAHPLLVWGTLSVIGALVLYRVLKAPLSEWLERHPPHAPQFRITFRKSGHRMGWAVPILPLIGLTGMVGKQRLQLGATTAKALYVVLAVIGAAAVGRLAWVTVKRRSSPIPRGRDRVGPSPKRLIVAALLGVLTLVGFYEATQFNLGRQSNQEISDGHGLGASPLRDTISYVAPPAERGTVIHMGSAQHVDSGDVLIAWEGLPRDLADALSQVNSRAANSGLSGALVSPDLVRRSLRRDPAILNALLTVRGERQSESIDGRLAEALRSMTARLRETERLYRRWAQMKRHLAEDIPRPLELERQEIWLRYQGGIVESLLKQRALRDITRATKSVDLLPLGSNGSGVASLEGSPVTPDKPTPLFIAESRDQIVITLRLPREKALALSNEWYSGTQASLRFSVHPTVLDSLPKTQRLTLPLASVKEIRTEPFSQDLATENGMISAKLRTNLAVGNNRTVVLSLRIAKWPAAYDPIWMATGAYEGLFDDKTGKEFYETLSDRETLGILSVDAPLTVRRHPKLEEALDIEHRALETAAASFETLRNRAEDDRARDSFLAHSYDLLITAIENDQNTLSEREAQVNVRRDAEAKRGILFDRNGVALSGAQVFPADPVRDAVNPIPDTYPRAGKDEQVYVVGDSARVRVHFQAPETSGRLSSYNATLPGGKRIALRLDYSDHPDPFVHYVDVHLRGALGPQKSAKTPALNPKGALILRLAPEEGIAVPKSNWERLREAATASRKPVPTKSQLLAKELASGTVLALIPSLFFAFTVSTAPFTFMGLAGLGALIAIVAHEMGHGIAAIERFNQVTLQWGNGGLEWTHEPAEGVMEPIVDPIVRVRGPQVSLGISLLAGAVFAVLFGQHELLSAPFLTTALASFYFTFADGQSPLKLLRSLWESNKSETEAKTEALSPKPVSRNFTPPEPPGVAPARTSPYLQPVGPAKPPVLMNADVPNPDHTRLNSAELSRLKDYLANTLTKAEVYWNPGETDKTPYLTWFQRTFLVRHGKPIRYKPHSLLMLENRDEALDRWTAWVLSRHYINEANLAVRNQTVYQYKWLVWTFLALSAYTIFNPSAVFDVLIAIGNSSILSSVNHQAYPIFAAALAWIVGWGLLGGGLERLWRAFVSIPYHFKKWFYSFLGRYKMEKQFREIDERDSYRELKRFHEPDILDPALASSTAPNKYSDFMDTLTHFAREWNESIITIAKEKGEDGRELRRLIEAALWVNSRQGTPEDAPVGMGAVPVPFLDQFEALIPASASPEQAVRMMDDAQWTDAMARLRLYPLPAFLAMVQHGLALLPIDQGLVAANGLEADVIEEVQRRAKHWRPGVYAGARAQHRFRQMFMLITKILNIKTANQDGNEMAAIHNALRPMVNFANPAEGILWDYFAQGAFAGKRTQMTGPVFTLVRRLFKISPTSAIELLSLLNSDASDFLDEPLIEGNPTEPRGTPKSHTKAVEMINSYIVGSHMIRKLGKWTKGRWPLFENRTLVFDAALMINRRQPSFDLRDMARATLSLHDVERAADALEETLLNGASKIVVTNVGPMHAEFMRHLARRVAQRFEPSLAKRVVFTLLPGAEPYLADPRAIVFSSPEPSSWQAFKKAQGWVVHVPSPFFYQSAVVFAFNEISKDRLSYFFEQIRARFDQDERDLLNALQDFPRTLDYEEGIAQDARRSALLQKLRDIRNDRYQLNELQVLIQRHADLLHSFGIDTRVATVRVDDDTQLPILRMGLSPQGAPTVLGRQDTLFILPPREISSPIRAAA